MNFGEHFEALSAALYSGTVRAADLKIMPGANSSAGTEARAKALLDSMKRIGIVKDSYLIGLSNH